MNPIITRASRPLAAVVGLAVLCAAAFPTPALAYGRKGHQTVGAIADELIQGSNAEKKVKALLGTETLSHASTWPDEVKHGPFTAETKAYESVSVPSNAFTFVSALLPWINSSAIAPTV